MRYKLRTTLLFLLSISAISFAQTPQKPSTSEIFHKLEKLNFLGSALYIAAHPDDENTRLISYLSNEMNARTAYLSVTRGDGGQNLIGPELTEQLGVIRTQELLAARRKDGGQQFFTRANDFGYSKHPDETLEIWNKEQVLGDVVRMIRKFKPDVIVNRFNHRTPGSTHGHHTSSAILSVEAFDLVGDATKYPKTAEQCGTWQPQRLFFNTSWWFYGSQENFEKADKSNLVEVETGSYYPELGLSNGEIAALSRSMHKSQGFGSSGSRGTETEYLELIKGTLPGKGASLFEGIDTTWTRIEGGDVIGPILYAIQSNFNFKDPSYHLANLMSAYQLLQKVPDGYWKEVKLKELEDIIADCAGLFLEATASEASVTPSGEVSVKIEAINRSSADIQLGGVSSPIIQFPTTFVPTPLKNNTPYTLQSVEYTFQAKEYSTPYWLKEEGTLGMYKVSDESLIGLPEQTNHFPVYFNLSIEGVPIKLERSIVYKFNDPVKGEVYQPFELLPVATSSIAEKVIIFSTAESKDIPVIVRAGKNNVSGSVRLDHPKGWTVIPEEQTFNLENKGATQTFMFKVVPPKDQSEGYIKPLIHVGDQFIDKELVTLDYEHIPLQQLLLPSQSKVVRIPIQKKGENIGYINGAGDAIPESLKQIGFQVTELNVAELKLDALKSFDAIVMGIRAYNTQDELQFKQPILDEYVKQGGTLIVQYNTSRGLVTDHLAPYKLSLSRERVTNEFAEVDLLAPKHAVLNTPNKITKDDFNGWVQERGLYFPDEWDPAFEPILGMSDPGEAETKGSLLVAEYGKGHYVYTGLSFFRELPAGVSGAYRLFANLLSLGN